MKTRIFSGCLVIFTLILLCLGQIGMAQGVISLPWTGQEKCYNSSGTEISCTGTGQDGEYQMGTNWPDPRFTSGGDCMTDNLTGLMWSKNANLPNGKMTWQEALDYVASVNSGAGLCGYHDWRLPNINELESLVNAGVVHLNMWLIDQGFSNMDTQLYSQYWSSTTSAVLTDDAWFSYMVIGYTRHSSKDLSAYYVWPVRSGQLNNADPFYSANIWKTGQTTGYASKDDGDLERGVAWPAPRFANPGDGIIIDNLTGLMWSKNANLPNGTMNWQGALDYVKALNSGAGLGGYHDWRLPNWKELFSLTDFSEHSPALSGGHPFENVQSNKYWSSTASSNNHLVAWSGVVWDGTVSNNYKSDTYFVWPVRSDYPDISVTPNPVPFGNVNVGDTWDQNITVGNSGTANLVIGTITNPAVPFSKQTDNCSGQTLSPGGTCTVTYRFVPTTSGNFSGHSSIPSNDPDENPVSLELNGTGSTAFSITVSKSGTGAGTVTSSPAGINCGDDCSKLYKQGTTVTLTATPSWESIFAGWSGACSGTGPCTITLSSNTNIVASFVFLENCAYTISPTNKTFNAKGGSVSIKVSATGQTNCPLPPVVEDAEWISVSGTPTWKGNKGTVKIAVQKNSSSQSRTGVVSIGGKDLTIEEDGAICQLAALKPFSGKYPNTGGSGSFDVTISPQDCSWNVATPFGWIHLDTTTGTGNGTAVFHIDANSTSKNRTGKIDVSLAQNVTKKKTFSVNESK
jgi:hypothetical protein